MKTVKHKETSESTSNDKALESLTDAPQVVFMGLCHHYGSVTCLKTSIRGVKKTKWQQMDHTVTMTMEELLID